MQAFIELVKRNPQRILLIVRSGLALVVGFGFQLSGEQVALIVVFVEAVLLLPSEAPVTPTAAPVLEAGTKVTVVTPEGEPNRVTTV